MRPSTAVPPSASASAAVPSAAAAASPSNVLAIARRASQPSTSATKGATPAELDETDADIPAHTPLTVLNPHLRRDDPLHWVYLLRTLQFPVPTPGEFVTAHYPPSEVESLATLATLMRERNLLNLSQ
eukprot:4848049-Amphidinium_carterae.1